MIAAAWLVSGYTVDATGVFCAVVTRLKTCDSALLAVMPNVPVPPADCLRTTTFAPSKLQRSSNSSPAPRSPAMSTAKVSRVMPVPLKRTDPQAVPLDVDRHSAEPVPPNVPVVARRKRFCAGVTVNWLLPDSRSSATDPPAAVNPVSVQRALFGRLLS